MKPHPIVYLGPEVARIMQDKIGNIFSINWDDLNSKEAEKRLNEQVQYYLALNKIVQYALDRIVRHLETSTRAFYIKR